MNYCKHTELALNKIGEPGEIDREIVEMFIENSGVHIYEDCKESHKFATECLNEVVERGDVSQQVADYYGVEQSDAAIVIAEFINYFANLSLTD